MRLALILSLFLAACQSAQSATPQSTPAPARNFVCERIALKNPTAKCEPEYTDVGELHTHTARVTIGADTVSCGINDRQLAVTCDGLFVASRQPDSNPPAGK